MAAFSDACSFCSFVAVSKALKKPLQQENLAIPKLVHSTSFSFLSTTYITKPAKTLDNVSYPRAERISPMSTAAQILANQANAQHSTGPITEAGKARVARNATKLGLFSTTGFVPPEERELYEEFVASYMDDLTPESVIEDTLADEIIQAAWRLRRCALIERRQLSDDAAPAELDRLQASIDRARATAQRTFTRSLAELRRVQSERVYRAMALSRDMDTENLGQADCRKLNLARLAQNKANAQKAADEKENDKRWNETIVRIEAEIAKQSQSPVASAAPIARNALCPCNSGAKYKRCCGKDAPPVLHTAA
jgi:hypothetical protein